MVQPSRRRAVPSLERRVPVPRVARRQLLHHVCTCSTSTRSARGQRTVSTRPAHGQRTVSTPAAAGGPPANGVEVNRSVKHEATCRRGRTVPQHTSGAQSGQSVADGRPSLRLRSTWATFTALHRLDHHRLRATGCGLRVAGYGLRVTGYALRATRYGLRVRPPPP